MARLRIGLADAKSQRKFVIELGMREVEVPAAIQTFQQLLIRSVSCPQPEANEIELMWGGKFKARIFTHPFGELLRQSNVLANVMLQSFNAIMPEHEPKLERPEPPPKLNVPVAIINDCARFRCLVAKEFRQHRKGLNQVLAVSHVKDVAIEVGEHPFMRIKAVTVGKLHAIVDEAKLRAEPCRSAHRGIDV